MQAARSIRQQQAEDTRARLFRAAAHLFGTFGYHATTVDQIVREAGVAKGTFFIHYATKDAVITELMRMQTRAARRARAATLGTAVDRLRAAVMTLGEQAGMSREVSRAVLAASLSSTDVGGESGLLYGEVYAEMIEDARAAQKARLFAASPDAETIAGALMASYLGAALHFASNPDSPGIVDVLRPIVEASLRGFMHPKAKETQDEAPRPRPRAVRRPR